MFWNQVLYQISDHKATYVSLKTQTILSHSYFREVWNYQYGDYVRLNNSKEQYDRDSIINDDISVDSAYEKNR